jgi:hypothetical protein
MECMAHGDLRSHLAGNGEVEGGARVVMAREVCAAMVHLAGNRMVQRELAGRKWLVAEGGRVKLGEVGMRRRHEAAGEGCGKRGREEAVAGKWMAGEAMEGRVITEASEVWSFGVVVWEVISDGAERHGALDARTVAAGCVGGDAAGGGGGGRGAGRGCGR